MSKVRELPDFHQECPHRYPGLLPDQGEHDYDQRME